MRYVNRIGSGVVTLAVLVVSVAFAIPMIQAMSADGFSVYNGSAPVIAAMIFAIMLPLMCVSAPGVEGRLLGVAGAAVSGWACGRATELSQAGDLRSAVGLVLLAIVIVAALVTVMRIIAGRRHRDVMRLARHLHRLSEHTTEALRDRFRSVPPRRDGPNPMADVTLVDRLINGAIGGAAGCADRDAFTRTLVEGLRELHASMQSVSKDGYAASCLDAHLHAFAAELRKNGKDLRLMPAHRPSKGQPVH